jgi:epoxyqueuosine reductase
MRRRPLLSERFRSAPPLLTFEQYLRPGDAPIPAHPTESRYPRIVPLVILDYGSVAARFRQMRYVGLDLLKAIFEMVRGARAIRRNPQLGKTRIDAAVLAELEAYARTLGVADVGYTRVDPRHIFRGFRVLYPNAIVFAIEMDREKIRTAPSIPSFIEVFRTYLEVGRAVNQIADFLRERGFNACAGPAVGGEVNYIPVARDAGLGEIGKNGLLITRANGPRVRLATVYTDIENLPFGERRAEFAWIPDYCETCNACVENCPADAIYRQPVTAPTGGPTFVDHTKCAKPFSEDNGCTLCIRHCPFSFADHDLLKDIYDGRRQRRAGTSREAASAR